MSPNTHFIIDITTPSTLHQQVRQLKYAPLAMPQLNQQTLAILRAGSGNRPSETLLLTTTAQVLHSTVDTEVIFQHYPGNKADCVLQSKLTLMELGLATDKPLPLANHKFALVPLGSYKDRSTSWVNLHNIVRIEEINRDMARVVLTGANEAAGELQLIVRQSQTWLYAQVQAAYILYRNAVALHNHTAVVFGDPITPVVTLLPTLQPLIDRIEARYVSSIDQPLVSQEALQAARTAMTFFTYGSWFHELFAPETTETELAAISFMLRQKFQTDAQSWRRHPETMQTRFAKELCTPTNHQRSKLAAFLTTLSPS